ncbi:hypothetical protein ANCCAN_21969 [Ancylostoma caninum]|uniref:Uncharacterized protein n=1 Tax=Ancylostoma caninum TaxID=29170 RepID=A0A368FL18_ANCCA|nr:hypothetical protein ANCCAN_21969 [Ancylostoma caninum]
MYGCRALIFVFYSCWFCGRLCFRASRRCYQRQESNFSMATDTRSFSP